MHRFVSFRQSSASALLTVGTLLAVLSIAAAPASAAVTAPADGAKLTAPNMSPPDYWSWDNPGHAVALSSDGTLAAVSTNAGSEGAVYIYRATGGAWSSSDTPLARLTNGSGIFGNSIALSADGKTLAVGVPRGRVWKDYGSSGSVNVSVGNVAVFHVNSPTDWSSSVRPSAVLSNLGASEGDAIGDSVAMSADGTTVVAGAPGGLYYTNGVGKAHVFRVASASAWSGGTETITNPIATLTDPTGAAQTGFGSHVALSGSGKTALLTGDGGAAYIFSASSPSAWTSTSVPRATLKGGTGPAVALASGTGATALVGTSVFDANDEGSWTSTSTPSNRFVCPDCFPNAPLGDMVALSSDGLAALLGAPSAWGFSGQAFVYRRAGRSQPWGGAKWLSRPVGPALSYGFSGALVMQGNDAVTLIGAPSSGGAAYLEVTGPPQDTGPGGLPKKKTTLTGSSSPSSVRAGATMSFNTTLSGGDSPTGTIDFFAAPEAWSSRCTDYGAGKATVTGNGTYAATWTANNVGKTKIYAKYAGDDKNEASACVEIGSVDLSPAKPQIALSMASTVAIGANLAIKATVSGGHTPSGLVTFGLAYSVAEPTSCEAGGGLGSAGIASDGTATLANGFDVPNQSAYVGMKLWVQATYRGDYRNELVCANAPLTITGQPGSDPAPANVLRIGAPAVSPRSAGKPISASSVATVMNGYPYVFNGGKVTFTVFGPQATPPTSCTSGGQVLGGPTFTENNPGYYVELPGDFTPGTAGTYWWYASWSGSAIHAGGNSGCGVGMVSTVVPSPPTILAPDPPRRVAVGTELSTSAEIRGQYAYGTVTFSLVNSKQSSIYSETVQVRDGVVRTSTFRPTTPGTYWWLRYYNGDELNVAVFQRDADSITIYNKATPTVSLSGTPTSSLQGGAIDPSSTAATVAGGRGPTGALRLNVFGPQTDAPTNCTSGGRAIGSRAITDNGTFYPSDGFAPTEPGNYWWYASYEGDAENAAANSTCGSSMPKTTVVAVPSGAGKALINEVRLSAAAGADQYVQVYNRSLTASLDVGGWTIVSPDGTLRTFAAGTILPPAGHLTAEADSSRWFAQSRAGGVKLVDRRGETVDAVGFAPAGAAAPAAGFREGTAVTVPAAGGQLALVRKYAVGAPVDTGDNAADFTALDTAADGTKSSVLGAPRPDGVDAPTSRNDFLQSSLPAAGSASASPNRVITPGLMVVNRRITNCSGSAGGTGVCVNSAKIAGVTVTKLRFRITDLTTVGSPGSGAVLKAVASSDATYEGGLSVKGLPVDAPSDPEGGGLNSTLTATALLPAGGLAPSASINVAFAFKIVKSGAFRFAFNTEDDLIPAAEGPSTETPSEPIPPASSEAPDTTTGKLGEATVADPDPAPVGSGAGAKPPTADTPAAARTSAFRPVLASAPNKIKPSKTGAFGVKVSCAAVEPKLATPARCKGTLSVTARFGKRTRTIATQAFSLAAGKPATVSLKLSAAARAALRTGSLKVELRAVVGRETATRSATIRKVAR